MFLSRKRQPASKTKSTKNNTSIDDKPVNITQKKCKSLGKGLKIPLYILSKLFREPKGNLFKGRLTSGL